MRVKEAAVTALYKAITPSVVARRPDLEAIEADARATESIALELSLRLELGRRHAAKVAAFYANRTLQA
jgi:hypothetical protein